MTKWERPSDYFKSNKYREQQKARHVASFEAETVSFVLRLLRLQKQESILRKRCAEVTGVANLRFTEFHEEFPSFPIYLGVKSLKEKKLHTHDKMMLPSLFKTFWEAPIVQPYLDFRETIGRRARERAVGLVFHRRGVPGGLVIHDGRDLPDRVLGGLALVYRPKHEEEILYEDFHGKAIYVQPLSSVVGALFNKGHGWRP